MVNPCNHLFLLSFNKIAERVNFDHSEAQGPDIMKTLTVELVSLLGKGHLFTHFVFNRKILNMLFIFNVNFSLAATEFMAAVTGMRDPTRLIEYRGLLSKVMVMECMTRLIAAILDAVPNEKNHGYKPEGPTSISA